MSRSDYWSRTETWSEGLCIAPPQDGNQGRLAGHQRVDGTLCDLFPAFAAMRGGGTGPNGEDSVEEEDTGCTPGGEVSSGRGGISEVCGVLLENIAQTSRKGVDRGVNT